jgi:hypothetical protein
MFDLSARRGALPRFQPSDVAHELAHAAVTIAAVPGAIAVVDMACGIMDAHIPAAAAANFHDGISRVSAVAALAAQHVNFHLVSGARADADALDAWLTRAALAACLPGHAVFDDNPARLRDHAMLAAASGQELRIGTIVGAIVGTAAAGCPSLAIKFSATVQIRALDDLERLLELKVADLIEKPDRFASAWQATGAVLWRIAQRAREGGGMTTRVH